MKLEALLDSLPYSIASGNLDVNIVDMARDSREVKQGWLFFAERGEVQDGHDFIETAISQGAAAIICEKKPETFVPNVAYIVIPELKKYVGILAHRFFGNPSEALHVIAVTGTNGKTSVATLMAQALEACGHTVALFGTVENKIAGTAFPATHTTPEAITLARLLARAQEAGVTHVCMEASSHALIQGRLSGMRIMTSIFTNLTQDHLDYHKTMEAYADAKKILFTLTDRDGYCIINHDDPYANHMIADTRATVIRVSMQEKTDISATDIIVDNQGISGVINGHAVTFSIAGLFNFSNRLLVIATLLTLEIGIPEACEVLQKVHQPRGRFEIIQKNDVTAIIDYAHTPDAVEKVLQTIQAIPNHNRIITIIGCGGNRDHAKRPIMARHASNYSDLVIFTSDNPRDEDPQNIINDMIVGVEKNNYQIILDRKEAIAYALASAQAGDIVAILGKGHETYQEIQGVKHHCDDGEEVEKFFSIHSSK